MGRKQRRDNVRNGGVAKAVAIGEHISVSKVVQDTKASSTKISYSRYVTGNRGWIEWTAAQGVASSGLGEDAAVRVCEYYYFRTNCFALGLSVGTQIVAALEGHYEATTRCGGGAWNVISSEGGALSTSGNPARSTNVHDIKAAHKKARARAGNTEVDSVDVLEPVHIRTFHALHFAGRELAACDPIAVMLHSAVTFGMSCMLRFSELSSFTTQHLGQSEMWPKFSLDEATKNSFKKQVYELAPWPTSVGLDPRLDPVLAFATWMRMRGGQPGFVFCHMRTVGGTVRMYHKEPMAALWMVSWMRRLYEPCGVLDANQLATHTAKRSGVQLYEALHQTPTWIMEKGGWTDPDSFIRYRALCNRPEQRYVYTTKSSW